MVSASPANFKTEVFNKTAISFYKELGFVETTDTVEDVEGRKVRAMVLEDESLLSR